MRLQQFTQLIAHLDPSDAAEIGLKTPDPDTAGSIGAGSWQRTIVKIRTSATSSTHSRGVAYPREKLWQF